MKINTKKEMMRCIQQCLTRLKMNTTQGGTNTDGPTATASNVGIISTSMGWQDAGKVNILSPS
ncbi:MAG: hypothetical protein Q7J15_07405 [Candidatus Desulfaltia sp.]|nr:hypothetical protein [Candidatus Desulfaltia sp.]